MRKLAYSVMTASVIALAGVAPTWARTAEKHERVVVQRYLWPNGVRTTHYQAPLESLPEPPGILFFPRPGERSVLFEFDDDVGEFVYVHVYQEGPGDADLDRNHCGPRGRFPLVGHAPVELRFYSGLCENHLVGVATQGTVRATFSTRSAKARPAHDHD